MHPEIGYKNEGVFQAALIRKIDEKISKYPSVYGLDFYHKPPAKRKITNLISSNIRNFTRTFRHINFQSPQFPQPYFLQDEYLREIFKLEELTIDQYIHLRQIKNPDYVIKSFVNRIIDSR